MKFFGWMQNKLTGKQQGNKPNIALSSHHLKQEFSDWPHGLLAIGTFGTNSGVNKEEIPQKNVEAIQEKPYNVYEEDQDRIETSSSGDLEDFTPEEVGKLQKELTKLLTRTKKRKSDVHKELTANNLPLDRFLNCPSSLEVDRRISNALCTIDCEEKEEENIERTISAILGRCKEISTENKKKKKKRDIAKASVSFLFKKIFVCTDGFSPKPSLRETLQESRMEKLLRTMLHKKINTQGSSRTPSMKKYLQDKQQVSEKSLEEEETREKNSDGYKWVKTDSDFIVLEI